MWFWLFAGIALLFGFVVFWGAPYVPSKSRDARRALTKLRPLTAADTLIDIGSGDGIILRIAAEHGARAIGYELNPVLVLISKLLSRNPRISVCVANFYAVSLPPETTVVYTFGDSRDIAKMANYVERQATRLDKSIDFISYAFQVPGRTATAHSKTHYLYRIDPLQ